ncbi:MAG: alpha/beta hydrolase [Alphaproteobacteria bacterium]|nr:alpha/beta hydrolase [Alphaproteobacteria bacterium]MDE2109502.1 alpha/beta hydrolase [Alphaproteobacteria bacterium]MDE2495351.1 alpha/beta hydrolase [Alphaproteobacteria bacterium]
MKRPPIVMLHGAFCGAWAFEDFAKPFAEAGYAVRSPALRHHDCGAKPPAALGRTSVLDYADDLERLIAGPGPAPILVGHSLGGLLAQMLAARGCARAAVLLAPSAPWGVMPTSWFEVASAQALYLAGDFWNRPLDPHYAVAAAHSLDKLSERRRNAVYARFVPESGRAMFEVTNWALDVKRAAFVKPRDVACPLLCIAGGEDKINPPSTVRAVAARYEGRAVFEEMPGRSHWLIGEEGWEKLAERILAWLADLRLEKEPSRGARA